MEDKHSPHKDFSHCYICGQTLSRATYLTLAQHLRRHHPTIKSEDYCVQYFYNSCVPLCACGCGQNAMWHRKKHEFIAYLPGHQYAEGEYQQRKKTQDFSHCYICEQVLPYNTHRSLAQHLRRQHPTVQSKDYYIQYFHGGHAPLCACGCGQEMKWTGHEYQFADYLQGHMWHDEKFTKDIYDKRKILNVDESFFKAIDTEEKAYWLGFIAADGNVNFYKLSIVLQDGDRGAP